MPRPKTQQIATFASPSLSTLNETVVHDLQLQRIIDSSITIINEVTADTSKRVYTQDAKKFFTWLYEQRIPATSITRAVMIDYRNSLLTFRWTDKRGNEVRYKNITMNRMFTVARRIVSDMVYTGVLQANPFERKIDTFEVKEETTHTALTEKQAEKLLELAEARATTLRGKRDYAIVTLLVRSGMRRDECVQLNTGDMKQKQGHNIADIEHGKGNKERTVKIPVDVHRVIEDYEAALGRYEYADGTVGRKNKSDHAPLFLSFRRGDHPALVEVENKETHELRRAEGRIDVKAIELLVKDLGHAIGVEELTPHGLRATFITLALKHGAPLHKVQAIAGHADPRTTERYDLDKYNLDESAVDVLSFLSRQ